VDRDSTVTPALAESIFGIFESLKTGAKQKILKFFVEGSQAVMIFLILDVSADRVDVRFRDTGGEVLILPCEVTVTEPILVHPVRRFALDELHDLPDRLIRPQRDQTMNVIDIPVDEINVDSLLAGVCADVSEKPLTDLGRQKRFTVLCGPDKMYPDSYPRHLL